METFEESGSERIETFEESGSERIPKLGFHVGKSSSYFSTITELETTMIKLDSDFEISNFPIQIFTGSTKSWRRAAMNLKDLDKTKKYIESKNIEIFIHSIYLINLARIGSEFEKAKNCLLYDLKLGLKLGCGTCS